MDNRIKERIKLATAMGWERLDHDPDRWFNDAPKYRREECRATELLPDPYTDANDDYAVLEWMRTPKLNHTHLWKRFLKKLHDAELYEIGDYARAALKVLT